jgi:hypothetical protein
MSSSVVWWNYEYFDNFYWGQLIGDSVTPVISGEYIMGNILNAVAKFYIMDNNSKWVDFSDFLENGGKNLLRSVSIITYSAETRFGSYQVQIPGISVKLVNDQGIFNEPFPSSLKTIDNSTASFSTSKNGKMSVLSNKKARISVILNDLDIITEYVVATYLVHGKMIVTSEEVTLTLNSLAYPLLNRDSAETVKQGLDYFTNRPVPFLTKELLLPRYHQKASYVLPTQFYVPDMLRISTAAYENDDPGDQRGLSNYGRMPEKDETGLWRNDGFVTRGCEFSYEYDDLGSAPIGSKDTLYYGADAELWRFDPTTEESTKIGDVSYYIHEIYYNANDYKLYIVCWEDDNTARGHNFKIYSYDGTSLTEIYSVSDATCLGSSFRTGDTEFAGSSYWRKIGHAPVPMSPGGENMAIPFRQYIKFGDTGVDTCYVRERDVLEDITEAEVSFYSYNSGAYAGIINSGFYIGLGQDAAGYPSNFNFQQSFGQKPFIIYVDDYGTSGGIVYSRYDSVNDEFDIVIYDINSDSLVVVDENINLDSNDCQPLCGCLKTGQIIYVAGLYTYETGSTTMRTYIAQYDLSSLPASPLVVYNSNSDTNSVFLTPLEMVYANSKLYLSVLDRNLIKKGSRYQIVSHPGTSQNTFDSFPSNKFSNQPHSLIVDSNEDVFFLLASTMQMLQIDVSESIILRKKDGIRVVDDDIWNRCICIDDTGATDIIYGFSSGGFPGEWMNSDEQEGKYFLWKFDLYLTGRIEYPNFAGMNVWDALSKLAQVVDCDFGFTPEGDFFLYEKPESTVAADYTITDDDTGDYKLEKEKDLEIIVDEQTVYNHVQIDPYVVSVAEPTYNFIQRPREADGSKNFDHEIIVQQRDSQKKKLKLTCLTSGKMTEKDILFNYFTHDEEVETALVESYELAETYLAVNINIDDFKEGDEIELSSADNKETINISSNPTSAQIRDKQLPISSSALSYTYSVGDKIKIKKINSGASGRGFQNLENDPFLKNWTADEWDEAIAENNADASEDTSIFLFSKQSMKITASGASPYVRRRYSSTLLKQSQKYTIIVAARGYIGDETNKKTSVEVQISGVSYAVSGWTNIETQGTSEWEFLKGTFTTSGSGASDIDLYFNLSDISGIGWIGGIFLLEGEHSEVDLISIGADNHFVPIGRSNIWLKFKADNDEEAEFKEGDILEITCNGRKLEKKEFFRAEYTNMDSKEIYGLNPYTTIDNPFISHRYVGDIARRIGSISPYPKMFIKCILPLNLNIMPINIQQKRRMIVNVKSERLKRSGGNTEKCQVLSVTHDLIRKRTGLYLVTFNDL